MKDEKAFSRELYIYLSDNSKEFKKWGKYLYLNDERFNDRPYFLALCHNALVVEKQFQDCLMFFILLRMSGVKLEHSEKWGMKITPIFGLENGFEDMEAYQKFMSTFTDVCGEKGRKWLVNTLKSVSTVMD